MKKIGSFLLLLMLCVSVYSQSITLQFTGQDASSHRVQLDRVIVTNLSQNWQETIYWPDTTLTLSSTDGIDDYANNSSFSLSQNNPNPFNGTTDVNLTVADAGVVILEIADANGRIVGTHRMRPQLGTHQFRVTLSAAGTYIMTARQNGKTSSIKMINNGGGGNNAIEEIGIDERTNLMKSGEATKGNVVHPWAYGDNLTIMGCATICGTECTKQFSRQLLYNETITIYFSESITTPTVAASSVSNITSNSASVSSSVGGECGVTSRGFCYGTTGSPTISGQHTSNGSGTGSFTGTLSGLTPGTTYYVRAYATNAAGTAYGSQAYFTIPASPTVTTDNVSSITINTATGGGNVTSQGTASVTARGVCWSTSHNPTIANSHTTNGSGTGTFTSNITGLTQGTTYYVRAYATNSVGTAYGNEVSFTTSVLQVPTVITSAVTNITATTATCGGEVTSEGGATVTEKGICISTSPAPTINDTHGNAGSGIGSFSFNLSNLSPQTTYYVRAYATNSVGTAYGNEVSFTTEETPQDGQPCPGAATLTDCDGNTYNTVRIGYQCWMKENLRTTCFPDNTIIPFSYSSGSATAPYRYAPYRNQDSVPTYGYLYNWAAVMHGASSSSANPSGVQRICPTGWHVPSNAEWTQLTDYVSSQSQYVCGGNNNYIAKALASTSGWNGSSYNTCAVCNTPSDNNATGFSAPPACYFDGEDYLGFGAYFWSATEDIGVAYRCYIEHSYPTVRKDRVSLWYGYSVRCLRDYGEPTVTTTSVTAITSNTATSGGNVISEGGSTVTVRGVCWSTSHNPTIANSHTTDGSGSGVFTSNITGLAQGTTYYVRAYATNSVGTAYGDEVSFTAGTGQPCPSTLTDRDGNTYNTVQIGTQCWMKENLRTTHYADDTEIPVGSTSSYTEHYRYAPNGDESNVAIYGYLYNWVAVMHGASSSSAIPSGVQGICPTGWHVPSDAEWAQLTDYVSSQSQYVCGSNNTYIAKALASTGGWGSSTNTCAVGNNAPASNNATGFSALPAGSYGGNNSSFGVGAYFWSATEYGGNLAYDRYLKHNDAGVGRFGIYKYNGFSVRCLRD